MCLLHVREAMKIEEDTFIMGYSVPEKVTPYWHEHGNQNSLVGRATGLDGREAGVRTPYRQNFSLLHVVQTGSGDHPASYPMGTGGSFLGAKAAGA
jgi:hypothetical protein